MTSPFDTAPSKSRRKLALTIVILGILFLCLGCTGITAGNANQITFKARTIATDTPLAHLMILTKSTHSAYLQAMHNRAQHSKMGNRASGKNRGYNLIHWNKGSAFFQTKFNEIAHTIDTLKPHIFSISEANLDINFDTSTFNLSDYKIEYTLMAQTTKMSRQILLIKNDVQYTRRHDLEDDDTCTIWVEICMPNKKHFLVMGGYRQWQLPRSHPQHLGSDSVVQQYNRFQKILTHWHNASLENKHIIVMMDDNIDTLQNTVHNQRYNVQTLKDAFIRHTQTHGIVFHNTVPTRYMSNTTPSCIDHISSNCPQSMHNIMTHNTGASDHCILTGTYSTKFSTVSPSFITTRDKALLTPSSLEQFIDNSLPLAQMFSSGDSETIADTLMQEFDLMINTIAPSRRVQTCKKHAPFIDTETLAQIAQRKEHYAKARQSNTPEDWRLYRHTNNTTNRLIKQKKIDFYRQKFDTKDDKTMWTTLKNLTNNKGQQQPATILHNNNFISSPRALANLANTHYVDKVNKIRQAFKKLTLNPIHILSTLIPRQQHTLTIPPITLAQTEEIIRNSPSSHSSGHDDITMHILKKVAHKVAPHITHLINTIIHTNTFPSTFKHSRITPILKPKKQNTHIDSFRPINNLCTLDKIVEQHIKTHLDTFLEKHNIIHPNHHGGRKKHSTTTALAQIYNCLHTQYEKGVITAILQTDLSAAFDTVDTQILLNKLEHYGIRGDTLTLFTSYLTQRTQYVEVNTFKSHTLAAPQCSVVQGSKLSGTLYTLYTNEIPLLHKLMGTVHYDFLTLTAHKIHEGVEHSTINFVDDSSNLISHKNAQNLSLYLTDFYTLLHSFYTINKLKINADKTELLVTCKPSLRHQANAVTMHAHQHVVEQQQESKILGAIINNKLKHTSHINTIVSSVNFRMHALRNIAQYTVFKTRLHIANAIIISTLTHLLPLFINAPREQLAKLQTLQNKTVKLVLGHHCFKWSTARMLATCNWHSIYHMLSQQSMALIHNIVVHKQPMAIYGMLNSDMQHTQGRRFARKLFMAHKPITDKLNDTLIYKALSMYNALPQHLISLNTLQFKVAIKKHVHSTQPPDSVPVRVI